MKSTTHHSSAAPLRRIGACLTLTVGMAAAAVSLAGAQAYPPFDWGSNTFGQLGDSTNVNRNLPVQPLSPAGAPINFVDVQGGYGHSLGLDKYGNVWSWGDNNQGQLGDGTHVSRSYPQLVYQGATEIACGDFHSIILLKDGTVWECGDNHFGQLGNIGPAPDSPNFVPVLENGVPGQSRQFHAIDIAGGGWHTLAIKDDQKYNVWSWGRDNHGQLGQGFTDLADGAHAAPGQVVGLPAGLPVVPPFLLYGLTPPYRYQHAIGAGKFHSLAIAFNVQTDSPLPYQGFGFAWGANGKGQLGDGTVVEKNTAVKIIDGTTNAQIVNLVSVRGGAGYLKGVQPNGNVVTASDNGGDSLLLKSDRTVFTMGSNDLGELGYGGADAGVHPIAKPVVDPGTPDGLFHDAVVIGGGGYHNLAGKADGTAWAWGNNADGELGLGFFNPFVPQPKQVMMTAAAPLTGVVTVSGGVTHSLALACSNIGQASMKGVVKLDCCTHQAGEVLTLEFHTTDGCPYFTRTAVLNVDGGFFVNGLPQKAFTIWVKGRVWLANDVNIDLTSGSGFVAVGTLLSGDSDNNNKVDYDDFLILLNAYGSDITIPGSGYDPAADYTCDGKVNFDDFVCQLNNFDVAGAPHPVP